MSTGGIGGARSTGFKGVEGPVGQVGKVGIPQTQAGVAEGAAAAGAVGGVDVPKIANEVAQTLGAAADKFKMLSGLNPFSQKAGMMMDMLAKGQETIKQALDDWGKFLREQAEKDKVADQQAQLRKQPVEQERLKNEEISKRFGA
jgi:hypothetical protein